MAFALLFNAVTINAIERRREFATMRAMGTRVTTIGFLVMLENVFLWLVVLAPGLVLGWWAAMQMGALFTSDLFFFEIVIFPSSYVITAAGVLVTMMLATLPAVRRIKRLNLADETRVLT
jgi:putative ABC transport system permease protein